MRARVARGETVEVIAAGDGSAVGTVAGPTFSENRPGLARPDANDQWPHKVVLRRGRSRNPGTRRAHGVDAGPRFLGGTLRANTRAGSIMGPNRRALAGPVRSRRPRGGAASAADRARAFRRHRPARTNPLRRGARSVARARSVRPDLRQRQPPRTLRASDRYRRGPCRSRRVDLRPPAGNLQPDADADADADARELARRELGLDRHTVLAVGRLVPIKGFDVLLRAVALAGAHGKSTGSSRQLWSSSAMDPKGRASRLWRDD